MPIIIPTDAEHQRFVGPYAREELSKVQEAVSSGAGIPMVMKQDPGDAQFYGKILGINPMSDPPTGIEIVLAGEGYEYYPRAERVEPCPVAVPWSFYDLADLMIDRFEKDGKVWWTIRDGDGEILSSVMVFIHGDGIDPDLPFQLPSPRHPG